MTTENGLALEKKRMNFFQNNINMLLLFLRITGYQNSTTKLVREVFYITFECVAS